MDSAQDDSSKKVLTLREAGDLLEVSIETLLQWNDLNILKPTISKDGEIVYTKSQIDQFLAIRNSNPTLLSQTPELSKKDNGVTESTDNSFFDGFSKTKKFGVYEKFLHWVGNEFYDEQYVKDYIKGEVKRSL